MLLTALTSSQPASSRKQTTYNYPIQPQHRFLQVGNPKGSVSVATLLPGDSSVGWVNVLEMTETGRGNRGVALLKARVLSALK